MVTTSSFLLLSQYKIKSIKKYLKKERKKREGLMLFWIYFLITSKPTSRTAHMRHGTDFQHLASMSLAIRYGWSNGCMHKLSTRIWGKPNINGVVRTDFHTKGFLWELFYTDHRLLWAIISLRCYLQSLRPSHST